MFVCFFAGRSLEAATLISWDIPTSTTNFASVVGTPASGITGTSITWGSGLVSSSSSTLWRVAGLNQTSSFNTPTTGANATGDYFQWTVTTGARTTASITGSTGFLWTGSGTGQPNAAEVWYSQNAGSSWTKLGSTATLGVSEVDVGSSWFTSGAPLNLGVGTSTIFRAAPLGATGGSSSPKLAWNAGTVGGADASLTGTTGGGAYNLVYNGVTGTWQDGATGLFTGTDFNNANSGNQTFYNSDNVTLGSSGSLTVAAGGVSVGGFTNNHSTGTLSVSGGSITATSLAKSGAGTLVLGSSNALGSVNVTAGTLVADDAKALGAGTLTLNGGKLGVTNAAVSTLANSISVGASGGTISNTVQTTLATAIAAGSGTLTKEGSGKLIISNSVGSSGSGNSVALNVSDGTLALTGGTKYLANSTIASGGNLLLDGVTLATRSIALSGAGTITVANTATLSNSAIGSGNSIGNAITISEGATLNTGNAGSSTYKNTLSGGIHGSGNLVVQSGETRLGGTSGSTGSATVNSGATLRLVDSSAASLNFTNNGTLVFDNSTGTKTWNGRIGGANGISTAGSSNQIFNGNITTTGVFTMGSTGDVTLGGNNSFGGMNITGSGDVFIKNLSALGSASGQLSSTVSTGRILVDSSAGTGNDWTIAQSVSTGTASNQVMAFAPGAGNALRLTNVVSGSGQLKVSGGGDLYVNNANNSYTGGTEIGTGRILVGSDAALGNGGAVNFGTATNSHLVATGALTLARSITIGSSGSAGYTANLDTGANEVTVSSGIANKTGNAVGGNLAKLGSGSLTLNGTNTYTGETDVRAGTLVVNGSIASSSLTTVESGATLKGSGSVGALEIASGGTLAVGNSPGTLTASSAKWNGGGIYSWELASALGNDSSFLAGQGSQWDFLNVTGVLDITATSGNQFIIDIVNLLALNDTSFSENNNYSFAIATAVGGITNFDSSDFNITGYLSGSNKWSLGVVNNTGSSQTLLLSYTGATAIPEPATGSLVLWAGMVVLGVRRLRRSRV